MPTVYIVQEPSKRDEDSGYFVPKFDFRPAEEYGALEYVVPATYVLNRRDPETVLDLMRTRLARFSEDDYLVPVGPTFFIAWAAVLAARACGGRLRLLVWQREEHRYQVVTAQIYDDEDETDEELAAASRELLGWEKENR